MHIFTFNLDRFTNYYFFHTEYNLMYSNYWHHEGEMCFLLYMCTIQSIVFKPLIIVMIAGFKY